HPRTTTLSLHDALPILHAEAQTQVRDAVVARVARRDHLALDPAVSETARHHDAGHPHERRCVAGVQLLGRHPPDVHRDVVVDARSEEHTSELQSLAYLV